MQSQPITSGRKPSAFYSSRISRSNVRRNEAAKNNHTIPDCLESLETLGIIAHHTENGTDRYYLAELQKTG